VKVAQKVGAKAGELRSWLRQLSELQRSFGVGVGDGEVEVEDFVEDWEEDEVEDFVLEVEVRDEEEEVEEEEEEETGVCETQRTCPIERSQFASRAGFQAYNWADVIPKLVSIK
jgi:transposase-like protein